MQLWYLGVAFSSSKRLTDSNSSQRGEHGYKNLDDSNVNNLVRLNGFLEGVLLTWEGKHAIFLLLMWVKEQRHWL